MVKTVNNDWLNHIMGIRGIEELGNHAKKIGYSVGYSQFESSSKVSHLYNFITIGTKNCTDNQVLYSLAHEIGHCYFTRIPNKYKLINEYLAWIMSVYICLLNRIPIRLSFFSFANVCLLSYWKYFFKRIYWRINRKVKRF